MKHAIEAFEKIFSYDFETVLDVGSGNDEHASAFRARGKTVTTVDKNCPADFQGAYTEFPYNEYDCVWSSHMLEHCTDPGINLIQMCLNLKEGGILGLTVPPSIGTVVIGHPIKWDAGHLVYNLVLAGFDCREVRIKEYGYNISILLKKKRNCLTGLYMGRHDFSKVNEFMPEGLKLGMRSDVKELNW